MKTLFKIDTIDLSTFIPFINEPKDSLFPEFLGLSRDPVLHSVLEFIIKVEALPFRMFFQGTKHMEIARRHVRVVPQLTLKLGSKLRHSHIQEGKDVYLECAIIANPSVSEIGWRFEDKELHTNKSAGIIVSNQSLVLQSVRRSNRGRYTCTADNSEGKGESAPLYLKVQYAPICKSDQKLLYGVARHEPVKVTCEVEADPSRANFTWKFNNSVESMDVLSFASEDSISIATYIPRTEYDYGTLLCWGKNSVGTQKEPCVFTVIPAGKAQFY
ncbi:hypothetical protein TNIN_24301 [Trichonephila inaurata madagascariensis]|uniref:Ig-like domain-containing protein n=1 Tax=Trichonephila inaurata madagascariensis TaxID=2747483 RepID=A0A8X6I7Q9_9ARAC|nr:hypothetical protein TNIN_24301 [Trichonephila inaurata madagascariensis]